MKQVQWGRSEDGFVKSKCGRFRIIPEFWGRVQPQVYRIEDEQRGGLGMATFETQKKCKDWVKNGLNPPKRTWPKITEDML